MEKKMAYKIAAVLVIGLFVFVSIALPVIAEATVSEGDTKVSVNDSGDGYIYWQEDGTEYMRLTGGNVGIGTTSPQNSLAVAGGVVIGSTYAGTASGSADGMVVEGQVGIGTTTLPAIFNTKTVLNPTEDYGGGADESDLTWGGAYTETLVITYIVEIDEDLGPIDTFKWSDDGGSSWNYGVSIETVTQDLSYGVQITFAAQDGHSKGEWWSYQTCYWGPLMLFNAADTLIFTVHNGGGVAIGQVPAEARLDVNPTVTRTDDYIGIKSDMEFDPGSGTMTTWTGIKIASPTITSGSITNKYALVTESGAGNVGIGTTSPTVELDVNGDIYSHITTGKVRVGYQAGLYSVGTMNFYADYDDTGDDDYIWYDNSESMVMTIGSSGNVGIGTWPSTRLHIDGDVAFGAGPSNLEPDVNDEVTVTHSYHVIDAATGTDNLETINGGDVAGQILIITVATSDTITIIDEDGNIQINGINTNFVMDDVQDTLTLIYNGSDWLELSRSVNN